MCLKYSLQEAAEPKLCDCAVRRREAAMSSQHHTYLINCQTGACICLSGDPRPPAIPAQRNCSTASRHLLRLCFLPRETVSKPSAEPGRATNAPGPTPRGKCKIPSRTPQSSPKTPQRKMAGGHTLLLRPLQESFKRCLRGLSCCVPTAKE